MKTDAAKERFEVVTVLGHTMLFTCLRVDRKTVPSNLEIYEVRHDDECQGDPCEIARFILVNHWGTLISDKPIVLDEDTRKYIDPETDWCYDGYTATLEEYMNGVAGTPSC